MSNTNIYPAILTDSLTTFQEELADFAQLPESVQTIHIDIIDGEFADNFTLTPLDILEFVSEDFFFDFHLMVNQPEDYLSECLAIQNTRAIIAQVEHMSKQAHFLEDINKNERMPGLSLDLYTPVEAIEEESWKEMKVLLLMGIEAGFQGREMKTALVIEKLREVSEIKRQKGLSDLEIIVDGGVNEATIRAVVNAGADSVVVGSALIKSDNMISAYKNLEDLAD